MNWQPFMNNVYRQHCITALLSSLRSVLSLSADCRCEVFLWRYSSDFAMWKRESHQAAKMCWTLQVNIWFASATKGRVHKHLIIVIILQIRFFFLSCIFNNVLNLLQNSTWLSSSSAWGTYCMNNNWLFCQWEIQRELGVVPFYFGIMSQHLSFFTFCNSLTLATLEHL